MSKCDTIKFGLFNIINRGKTPQLDYQRERKHYDGLNELKNVKNGNFRNSFVFCSYYYHYYYQHLVYFSISNFKFSKKIPSNLYYAICSVHIAYNEHSWEWLWKNPYIQFSPCCTLHRAREREKVQCCTFECQTYNECFTTFNVCYFRFIFFFSLWSICGFLCNNMELNWFDFVASCTWIRSHVLSLRIHIYATKHKRQSCFNSIKIT